MAVLQQLGINETYFFQLGIFILTLIILSSIFRSFVDLAKKRQQQTSGGELNAVEIFKKTTELQDQYGNRAKELNDEIKKIYDAARNNANEDYEKTVVKARQTATQLIDANHTKIAAEITEAKRRLTDEIPAVAAAMTQKLLQENGKN